MANPPAPLFTSTAARRFGTDLAVWAADGYLSGPLHDGRGPLSGKRGMGIPGQAVPSAGNQAPASWFV